MRLYKFNFHANHQTHVGERWATSSYDVERAIRAEYAWATGIDVWVA